jgi:hypothetical protein
MKLPIIQLPLFSCYFIPLGCIYEVMILIRLKAFTNYLEVDFSLS